MGLTTLDAWRYLNVAKEIGEQLKKEMEKWLGKDGAAAAF